MIRVNANLFRIAYTCASTEETRYYLNGVLVEPLPDGGVLLVTTDGHRLLCIYDRDGMAKQPTIVQLKKEALRSCVKPKIGNRYLEIVDETKPDSAASIIEEIVLEEIERTPIASSPKAIVDGTFPDYRRVVPKTLGEKSIVGGFNPLYVADFATIAADLAWHFLDRKTKRGDTKPCTFRLVAQSEEEPGKSINSPTTVLFSKGLQAFGIIMPTQLPADAPDYPEWFKR